MCKACLLFMLLVVLAVAGGVRPTTMLLLPVVVAQASRPRAPSPRREDVRPATA